MTPLCIVVMGVCGSGKSSVAEALATAFNYRLIDGDDLHPRSNIDKMKEGIPLTDTDREPWLRIISDVIYSFKQRTMGSVIVCSALKKSYRDILRNGNDNVVFIHLYAPYETILERVLNRKGHYMKEGMVKSQFDTLQMPDESESDVYTLDVTPPLAEICEKAISKIREITHG